MDKSFKGITARHQARIATVQALYMHEQTSFNGTIIANTLTDYHLAEINEIDQESDDLKEKKPPLDQAYFEKLIKTIPNLYDQIDPEIEPFLQDHWTVKKLASVVRCILRSGTYELKYEPLVPVAVIVNEYIEVARLFVDERDVKFINSVLDKISKNVRNN